MPFDAYGFLQLVAFFAQVAFFSTGAAAFVFYLIRGR